MRKELWFGVVFMATLFVLTWIVMPAPSDWTNEHFGLLMLSLVVAAIMLGFPTAFTLMGMGVIFSFLAYRHDPSLALQQTLDLFVQRTFAVMGNDVLIAVPLFVFMGYLVERAALIEKLFKSLHLSMSWIPGSLAVATLATCTLFSTATGIVGAVVTLMGLLAFPAMLKAGYDVKLSAGAITAGGCLGILIPPSVLLILYGATAGVSVVQLYAGAFFPGLMLASMYIGYVILRAKLNPSLAPKPPESELHVPLPAYAALLSQGQPRRAVPRLLASLFRKDDGLPKRLVLGQLGISLLPAVFLAVLFVVLHAAGTARAIVDTGGLQEMGASAPAEETGDADSPVAEGVEEPPPLEKDELAAPGIGEPPPEAGNALAEPPPEQGTAAATPTPAAPAEKAPSANPEAAGAAALAVSAEAAEGPGLPRKPTPRWFWIVFGVGIAGIALHYSIFTFERLQIFKMLLGSFFPLTALILAVLGSIVFGWATPTEAAALGGAGGMLLAGLYRQFKWPVLKESVFLTAKTTAMVCWLFVGSGIFSAAFALLGGQTIIERWVLAMDLTPVEFMILAQVVIFLLGWPLEWTEIIVIFMPIFIPLLGHFQIDPLFFGLLVALNLQTAFLSPPVAMAAFYLKGVAPPHVTLNQIFAGMMPFMVIQVFAIVLLYVFPEIGLWLPSVLYR
jgi:TRAP-type mannitol/chloroaromatic compound transport system permease large subunit